MVKIRCLCKDTFKDILINPGYIQAVLPVFISGITVISVGTDVGVERAMLLMSNGQQFIADCTVDEFFMGNYDGHKEVPT